jgi:hypothetical protein
MTQSPPTISIDRILEQNAQSLPINYVTEFEIICG